MFDHLLESSRRDDSNKWSNKGFGREIMQVVSIKDSFTHLIWRSEPLWLDMMTNKTILDNSHSRNFGYCCVSLPCAEENNAVNGRLLRLSSIFRITRPFSEKRAS